MKRFKLFILAVFVVLSNVTVFASNNTIVKVGLTNYKDMLSIHLKNNELYISQKEDMGNSEKLSSEDGFIFERNGDNIDVYINGELYESFEGDIFLKPTSIAEHITIGSRQYRGILQITSKINLLNAVNILPLEEYLYGVVAMEIPHTWEIEAIKAQAVSARSFTISNIDIHERDGYNLCDTVHCHAYNGVTSEQETTTEAVDETKGTMIYYDDEVINAVYHSSSGGYTDNSENVWFQSLPYLRAIEDVYEQGAKKWERVFTFEELSQLTGIQNVNEVILRNSSLTERVISVTFVGDNDEKEIAKEEVRTFFGKSAEGSLPSTNFKFSGTNFDEQYEAMNKVPTQQEEFYDTKLNPVYVYTAEGISEISQSSLLSSFVVTKNGFTQNEDKYILSANDILNSVNNSSTLKTSISDEYANDYDVLLQGGTFVTSVNKNDVSEVSFSGSGWGHGLGLSQYGANSLAKIGYSYEDILNFYYTNITIA